MLSLTNSCFVYFLPQCSTDFSCCKLWLMPYSSTVYLWEAAASPFLILLSRHLKAVIGSFWPYFLQIEQPRYPLILLVRYMFHPLNSLGGCLLDFVGFVVGRPTLLNIQPNHSTNQKRVITSLQLLIMLLSMQSSVFLAFIAGIHRWLVFSSTNSFNLGLDFSGRTVQLQS